MIASKEMERMTSIFKEIVIEADPGAVWSAVRDVGAVHQRLAPGFVVDARLEGNARVVTFANGMIARETIVHVDDDHQRLAYAAIGGRATHHSASLQVFAEGDGRTRLLWITDLLPDELDGPIREMVEQGAEVMKRALESGENLG
jgi:carbon monoxide dehydrogenase subunit G